MLEEIFTVDEMVDNLRVVYKNKSEKESFELIKITNGDGNEAVVPFSKKSLYDMYMIIGKKLRTAFDDAIEKDIGKKQKFREMKAHDKLIDEIVSENMENSKSNISKIKEAFRDGFLINRTLMEEFRVHKLTNITNDTIREETGLLDNYNIGKYLELYHDVDIDFESLLISAVNTYTKYVSDQTKAHYPKITDYGTAYEYFYKMRIRTLTDDDAKELGRLYYRKLFNDNMLEYATNKCKKMVRKSIFTMITSILIMGIVMLPVPYIRTTLAILGFVISVTGIDVIVKLRQSSVILERLKTSISHEDQTLEKLVKLEQSNINKWYQKV